MKLHLTSRQRGFTLIEMIVVISLMMVLLAIALPMYNRAVVHAREAKLHSNVALLNGLVEHYSQDKGQAPQSLDDLVTAGYIKEIPEDITGSKTTWETEQETPENCWDPNQCGIGSVHSGSRETGLEGTPYASWTH